MEQIMVTSDVGRLVFGSAGTSHPVTDIITKQPKLDSAGQQRHEYALGVAIPKNGSTHWNTTEWGSAIWNYAHQAWTNGESQRNDFAFKIIDGDSNIPNKNNRIPCEQEGYAGHWVVTFKNSFAPQLYNRDGTQVIGANEFYKGCYVQVRFSVTSNNSPANAGVYLNQAIIALSGHGEPINSGPDVGEAGFGSAALPQGASATPIGGMQQQPMQQQPMQQQPMQQQPMQQQPMQQQPMQQQPMQQQPMQQQPMQQQPMQQQPMQQQPMQPQQGHGAILNPPANPTH